MKEQLTGSQKIQEICSALKEETLQPAKQEAQRILEEAEAKARDIVHRAEQEAESIVGQGRQQIQQERSVFESNLSQAAKQSIQALRQEIESKLFNDELDALLKSGTGNSHVVAQLITAVVHAIEKQGIGADLEALIPQQVPAEAVSQALGQEVSSKLQGEGVSLGRFFGGAQVRIRDQRMTIDISDAALKELLESYVRKDFRAKLFGEESQESHV